MCVMSERERVEGLLVESDDWAPGDNRDSSSPSGRMDAGCGAAQLTGGFNEKAAVKECFCSSITFFSSSPEGELERHFVSPMFWPEGGGTRRSLAHSGR